MNQLLRRTALGLAVVWAVLPMYWLVITAIKPRAEIFDYPPSLIPHNPTLRNFASLLDDRPFGDYLRNSLVAVTGSVVLALALGSFAAYALARFRLLGGRNESIGFSILATRMIPPIVLVVPLFLMAFNAGLLNTATGLVLLYTAVNLPFVIWMMRSFIEEIPPDLEEAAMTDGASRLYAFRTVLLPLLRPGLIATAIFAVIVTYNEFLFALVLTSTPDAQTLPVGAATLLGRSVQDVGGLAAAGVVMMIPIVVFALLVQRHLVRGLTMGSFK